MSASENPAPNVPQPILAVVAALNEQGRNAWLVGEPLHDLLVAAQSDVSTSASHDSQQDSTHCAPHRPAQYALATSASAEEIAACFEHAVQVDPQAACLVLPTRAGSVDLLPLRNGSEIEADLAHRGFTILAMAYSPQNAQWIDPYGGLVDLKLRRLRAVTNAADRLAEDPIRALRAARLAAQHGYELDPELVEAIRGLPASIITALPAPSVQAELRGIFDSERAGKGLAMLRESGVESALARGAGSHAAALVDRLPRDLALRLVAWLCGAKGGRLLGRLRFDRPLVDRFLRLTQYHPLDRSLAGRRRSSLCRLVEQLGEADLEALFALREHELDVLCERHEEPHEEGFEEQAEKELEGRAQLVAARVKLDSLREEIALATQEMQRKRAAPELVLTGGEVMRILGSPPGPRVGAALRYLRDFVRDAPELNHPSELRDALSRWAEQNP